VEQYGLVLLISLPLFILASAGSTVFWIIGEENWIYFSSSVLLLGFANTFFETAKASTHT